MKIKNSTPISDIAQPFTIGYHGIWDISNCQIDSIARVEPIKELLTKLVDCLDLKILGEQFHQFQPWGATGIMLLSESHISIHTWPEKKYAAIDLFSCKSFDHNTFQEHLIAQLGEVHIRFQLLDRGTDFLTKQTILKP